MRDMESFAGGNAAEEYVWEQLPALIRGVALALVVAAGAVLAYGAVMGGLDDRFKLIAIAGFGLAAAVQTSSFLLACWMTKASS